MDYIRKTITGAVAAESLYVKINLLWDFIGIADRVVGRTGYRETVLDRKFSKKFKYATCDLNAAVCVAADLPPRPSIKSHKDFMEKYAFWLPIKGNQAFLLENEKKCLLPSQSSVC